LVQLAWPPSCQLQQVEENYKQKIQKEYHTQTCEARIHVVQELQATCKINVKDCSQLSTVGRGGGC